MRGEIELDREKEGRREERGRGTMKGGALLWSRAVGPAASPRALLKCSQGETLEWGLAIQLNQASVRFWRVLEFETH